MNEFFKALCLRLIKKGLKTIDEIPESYREEIREILDAQESGI